MRLKQYVGKLDDFVVEHRNCLGFVTLIGFSDQPDHTLGQLLVAIFGGFPE